ncbi:MAG: DEAD/DEAH box helicase [Saprospiraceae bacterium]
MNSDATMLIKAIKSPNLMHDIRVTAQNDIKRYIVGKVDGYVPKIFYNANLEIHKVECDCRSSDPRCVHVAHLLIHLKKMSDHEFLKDTKKIAVINKDQAPMIDSILKTYTDSVSQSSSLIFTTVDSIALATYASHKVRFLQKRQGDVFIFLTKGNLVNIEVFIKIHSDYQFLAELTLLREDDTIIVKSYQVDSVFRSFNIENEMVYLLADQNILSILTNRNWYNYEAVLAAMHESSKISISDIRSFVKIRIEDIAKFSLIKSEKSYLVAKEVKTALDFSQLKPKNRNELIKEVLIKSSKQDYLYTNVILWTKANDKKVLFFELGKAKLNKAQNKIISNFKICDQPEYWTGKELQFYKNLENITSQNTEYHILASQIALLLKSHAGTISNMYHAMDIIYTHKYLPEYNINDVHPFKFSESVLEIFVEILESMDKYVLVKYFMIDNQKHIFYDESEEESTALLAKNILSQQKLNSPFNMLLAQLPKYNYDKKYRHYGYNDEYDDDNYYDDDDDEDYEDYDDDYDEDDDINTEPTSENTSNGTVTKDSVKDDDAPSILDYITSTGFARDAFFITTRYHYMNSGFCLYNDQGYVYANPSTALLHKKISAFQIFDKTKENLEAVLHALEGIIDVTLPESMHVEVVELHSPAYELYLSESEDYIQFKPVIRYQDDIEIVLPVESYSIYQSENEALVRYDVLPDDVDVFIRFLDEAHPALKDGKDQLGQYYLHINILLENVWFLDFFERCREHKISIFGQENLSKFKFNPHKAQIKVGISSGIDWFDVNVDIKYGKHKVHLKSWIDAVKQNQKFIQLSDGSLGLLPTEWVEKLKTLSKITKKEGEKLVINKYNFSLLDLHFDSEIDAKLRKEINKKVKLLQDFDGNKKYPLPQALKAELRPYQKEGYQWLKALDELNFGGCLADDMGLGKTVQVLSFFADQAEKNAGSSLVIVPKSLLFNWDAEINKFCPSLNFIIHHGSGRRQDASDFASFHLVITTYDTATSDIEWLKDVKFHYIVLDESQAIKNPGSQRYKAMRLLQATNRMVMTGTPIENNTFDLFAQFSFINPGIFGSANNFREEFAIPIDKHKDEQSSLLLHKMVKPFLLRRTKGQVATDLPERIENIIYCEMGSAQRMYYDAMKNEIRQELLTTEGNGDFSKSKLKVIEGLLRLRQICNSPKLINPSIVNDKNISVKIDTLMDIIENELGDHNALIFSQFTSMLALIKNTLDSKRMRYAYLDGSTNNRKAAVQEFEDNDDIKLFLISLKAGNTGLNLTKADYVYIIDPWWNPAVEAQAIDRTHRIGQTKNVFAYKLVCKDTIEEKIIQLQMNKKSLSESIISTDENVFNSLNKDELLDLFK